MLSIRWHSGSLEWQEWVVHPGRWRSGSLERQGRAVHPGRWRSGSLERQGRAVHPGRWRSGSLEWQEWAVHPGRWGSGSLERRGRAVHPGRWHKLPVWALAKGSTACHFEKSVCACVCVLVTQSRLTLPNPMDLGLQAMKLAGPLSPWNSPGKNTGEGCHFLFQGIFPTQGLNQGLLHCRWILYCLSTMLTVNENRYIPIK